MTNTIKNVEKKTETGINTSIRYRTPDGLIFTSREEYLDYMEGLRN